MFFSVNLVNSVKNIDLASVIALNTASAEDDCDNWFWACDSLYTEIMDDCVCVCTIMMAPGGVGGSYTIPGSTQVCESGGPDFCLPSLTCSCGYV